MNTMTLQVPVNREIKISAQNAAESMGFSSLQDAVRLFLANLASRSLSINFTQTTPDEKLTPKQEKVLLRKYRQAKKEIAAGRGYSASSAEELIAQLRA